MGKYGKAGRSAWRRTGESRTPPLVNCGGRTHAATATRASCGTPGRDRLDSSCGAANVGPTRRDGTRQERLHARAEVEMRRTLHASNGQTKNRGRNLSQTRV